MNATLKPENEISFASWNDRSKNRYIEIKISRNTAIAILISLAVHALVLFVHYPKKQASATSTANFHLPSKSFSVQLAGLPSKKTVVITKPPKPKSAITPEKNYVIPAPPRPVVNSASNPENNAPKDLMSFIKARKQLAQDMEEEAARENANARQPTYEERRDANIKNNLQQPGTSGIFEIQHIGVRSARFSFKGWKTTDSIPHMELIDVEAGADGNIELAIVRKMIAIIRREYKGDFNWESQRLGRIIVLSARMEDNAGLEDFLMQEFFSARDY